MISKLVKILLKTNEVKKKRKNFSIFRELRELRNNVEPTSRPTKSTPTASSFHLLPKMCEAPTCNFTK